MKSKAAVGFIFSVRAFAAAVLALYIAYSLDLSRPTWAFISTYVAASPLLGMGRSRGLYRIFGTLGGAVFSVAVLPNLVNMPELMVLAVASWIGGCLYLSTIDGTPRSYAFVLSGYTAAIICFPSVGNPGTIFDTALARTEEIGVAIFCVELMGYLPFNRRAGDLLLQSIDQWLLDARAWAIDVLQSHPENMLIADRSRLMTDAVRMDAFRIYANYDTPGFADIEGWVIRLQRYLQDFFADLVTLEAQMKMLAAGSEPHALLRSITNKILAWIESGEMEIPPAIVALLQKQPQDDNMRELMTCGIVGTLSDMMVRRSECMKLRANIRAKVKVEKSEAPLARYVDHIQAAIYGLAVAGIIVFGSLFWIKTGWPEGALAVLLGTVIYCLQGHLEAPRNIILLAMMLFCIGGVIGWCYNFVIFPKIDGFLLFACVLGVSCIPLGMLMSQPAKAGTMVPAIFAINIANFDNRYSVDVPGFLNSFTAELIGVMVAAFTASLVRNITLCTATKRLIRENGKSLAVLASEDVPDPHILDHMAYRAGLAFSRSPSLQESREKVIKRVMLDLQAGRALVEIKKLLPKIAPQDLPLLRQIEQKIVTPLRSRGALDHDLSSVKVDLRKLTHDVQARGSYEALRLAGLLRTLGRGLEQGVA
jgi:uncharacterized membrane protein YccC